MGGDDSDGAHPRPVLVGRHAELAIVEDALIDAARSDGRFVVIAGDAGIGKTA